MNDRDELGRVEQMGTRLGYLGLIPFIFGTVAALLSSELAPFVLDAFLLYSVVILSFMGGVHWGLALVKGPRRPGRLFLSVIPALIGWLCLLSLPQYLTLAVLGGTYITQWFVDKPILIQINVPLWYLEMRSRLAYIVAGCHLFMLFRLMSP